jgi:hypothetical protein
MHTTNCGVHQSRECTCGYPDLLKVAKLTLLHARSHPDSTEERALARVVGAAIAKVEGTGQS